VGARLLEAVGDAQATGPLAILVDDLQWADRGSVEALTFTLRRLSVDPVVAVVTYQGTSDRLDGAGQRMLRSAENRHAAEAGVDIPPFSQAGPTAGAPSSLPVWARTSLAGLAVASWVAVTSSLPASRRALDALDDRPGPSHPACCHLRVLPVGGGHLPQAATDAVMGADRMTYRGCDLDLGVFTPSREVAGEQRLGPRRERLRGELVHQLSRGCRCLVCWFAVQNWGDHGGSLSARLHRGDSSTIGSRRATVPGETP
jgi:hypothetical protein